VNNKNNGRIISLNLRHGGGARISQITEWLVSKSPSTVIATEWRNNIPGQILRNRLSVDGLTSTVADTATSQSNTVSLAKSGVHHSETITPPNSLAGGLVFAGGEGFNILGCYFPQGLAKAPFFHRCIEIAKQYARLPLVMVGDLNTGRNDLDIEGNGVLFDCADLFEGLNKMAGLVDLWRERHGDRRDWTGSSNKNGFRIDHAFGNQALIDRFPNFRCEIDHEPRLTKLTDHSAIIIDF
jgi:exonuclease III